MIRPGHAGGQDVHRAAAAGALAFHAAHARPLLLTRGPTLQPARDPGHRAGGQAGIYSALVAGARGRHAARALPGVRRVQPLAACGGLRGGALLRGLPQHPGLPGAPTCGVQACSGSDGVALLEDSWRGSSLEEDPRRALLPQYTAETHAASPLSWDACAQL